MRTSSLYLLVLCGIRASWALQNDFSAYPQGSQGCLNDAANQSQCSGNTGQQLNQCLCTNQGNFIYNSGSCIAQKSPKDLESVYDTLQNNCQGTGVTLTVSKQAFLANAAAATSSSATNSPTSSSTSSSPPTSDSSSSSSSVLATGAIVGIAVGGVAVIALIGAGIWLLLRRRRAQRPSSVQPHLPPPEASEYTGYNHQSPYNQPAAYNQRPLQTKYAHHEGAAELDNSEYMAAAVPGYSNGKQGADVKRHDHSDVPLLAELGSTQQQHEHTQSSSPAELPADEYMHGGRRPGEDV